MYHLLAPAMHIPRSNEPNSVQPVNWCRIVVGPLTSFLTCRKGSRHPYNHAFASKLEKCHLLAKWLNHPPSPLTQQHQTHHCVVLCAGLLRLGRCMMAHATSSSQSATTRYVDLMCSKMRNSWTQRPMSCSIGVPDSLCHVSINACRLCCWRGERLVC